LSRKPVEPNGIDRPKLVGSFDFIHPLAQRNRDHSKHKLPGVLHGGCDLTPAVNQEYVLTCPAKHKVAKIAAFFGDTGLHSSKGL
jgi:hypothetical protein